MIENPSFFLGYPSSVALFKPLNGKELKKMENCSCLDLYILKSSLAMGWLLSIVEV